MNAKEVQQVEAFTNAMVRGSGHQARSLLAQIAAQVGERHPDAGQRLSQLARDPWVTHVQTITGGPPAETLHPSMNLHQLVLAESTLQEILTIVREHRMAEQLLASGLQPSCRLLFHGPSGTGKTAAAACLAAELGQPLHVVRMEGVISSHLGDTGKALAGLFAAMRATPGVWLLDEFDVIGWHRSGPGSEDLAEMRRVVNSLLVALEHFGGHVQMGYAPPAPGCVLVATTNHRDSLDGALFRRFDALVVFELPNEEQRRLLFGRMLKAFEVAKDDFDETVRRSGGMSHGDVVASALRFGRALVVGREGQRLSDCLQRAGEAVR